MSPTATTTRVVLERRYNGPPETANGGYACGVVARHVDGPAHVSLRRPVPLGSAARARAPRRRPRHPARRGHPDRGGRPGAAAGRARAAVPARPRGGARGRRARPAGWPAAFGRCWVCSPREDGLGVLFGPLPRARSMTGAVLHAGDGGTLAPEVVWAALDCPSYTPAAVGQRRARACSRACTPSCSSRSRPASRWPSSAGRSAARAASTAARPRSSSATAACSRAPRRCGSVYVADLTFRSSWTCLRR